MGFLLCLDPVRKLLDGGLWHEEIYKVTITSIRKQDAVDIFNREHPDGLICSGIRRGDFKLIPFKELPSHDPWEESIAV